MAVTRSILVTGSGSGIGAAIARRLAGPGVGLVLHARANKDGCEAVAEELRHAGAEVVIEMGDLAEDGTAERLVERALGGFGGLDCLVANAGFPIGKSFPEASDQDLAHCFAVMQRGFFALAQHGLPALRRSKMARVIAVSTFNAHVFRPKVPIFPASASAKAGLEALVRALAVELAPTGGTANCVAPGLIAKESAAPKIFSPEVFAELLEQVPLARLGQPDEVAAVAAFLASAEAGYVTGQVIHVNGGLV